MRLRRFLISEPMTRGDATRTCQKAPKRPRVSPLLMRSSDQGASVDWSAFGGGVTAAQGPLKPLAKVRNLPPEPHDEGARMKQYRPLSAVVLAAGEGTRMRSGTPKVLH